MMSVHLPTGVESWQMSPAPDLRDHSSLLLWILGRAGGVRTLFQAIIIFGELFASLISRIQINEYLTLGACLSCGPR